jgi:hypothetical protein
MKVLAALINPPRIHSREKNAFSDNISWASKKTAVHLRLKSYASKRPARETRPKLGFEPDVEGAVESRGIKSSEGRIFQRAIMIMKSNRPDSSSGRKT